MENETRTKLLLYICLVLLAVAAVSMVLSAVGNTLKEKSYQTTQINLFRNKDQERIPSKYRVERYNNIEVHCAGDMLYFSGTRTTGQVYDYDEDIKQTIPVKCLPKK